MKVGLSTKDTPEGIVFQVRRPNGQIAWEKFVRWGQFKRNRARYEAAAREAERNALERRKA